jgi:hypothetical protein
MVKLGLAGSWIAGNTTSTRFEIDRADYRYGAWRLETDFLNETEAMGIQDYFTNYFPVVAGFRYKLRLMTTRFCAHVQLWLKSSVPNGWETCEKSDFVLDYGIEEGRGSRPRINMQ